MSHPTEPIISVSRLSIERKARLILDTIDWRVMPGEHWVVMGANGSGKTSLLHALVAYLSPTRGSISVLGEEYGHSDWRDLRKRVGIVSSAIPEMMPAGESAIEVVASGKDARVGMLSELSANEIELAREILDRVECPGLGEQPWRVLSQGERQRLLIGRALVGKPALLILDEPCVGLDPVARERFLSFLDRLVRAPAAPNLVLVTHHVEEIASFFSHVLLLSQGRVLAQGAKQDVLTSDLLSRAFQADVRVEHKAGRYSLAIEPQAERIC